MALPEWRPRIHSGRFAQCLAGSGHGRFAFRGVDANIPGKLQGTKERETNKAALHIQGGQLGKIPIGQVDIPLEIDGSNLRIPRLTLPVLDGELTLENSAHRGRLRAGMAIQRWLTRPYRCKN